MMISFYNDYNELCHPRILEDLSKFQGEKNIGYSNDQHVLNAVDFIKKEIGRDDIDVHFIHGGTMVNILSLKTMLQVYEGIISCDTGHIIGHENGAIEAIGHQVVQIPHKKGKVTVEELEKALAKNSKEYSVKLKVVYLSNATELGTVYTKEELEKIYNFCKLHDLYIYMDGARLGSALASSKNDMSLSDIAKYCDVFTIGGTKNGMLLGEAMIITNPEFSKGIRRTIKQRGAMMAKGYMMGIQFETMFKDGLYLQLADHAIKMAEYLAGKLENLKVSMYEPQESNLVFPLINKNIVHKMTENFMFDLMDEMGDKRLIRLVTRWSTTKEEIDSLINFIEGEIEKGEIA